MRRSPRRWTAQEDVVLLEKAKQQIDSPTGISWGSVSNAIPNRNNKDCRKRWYKLTGTKKGFWTASEDERLMEGVQKYGSQWVRVAEVVGPGTRNPDRRYRTIFKNLNWLLETRLTYKQSAQSDGNSASIHRSIGANGHRNKTSYCYLR